ncbi:MAG: hypothetical protein KAT43_01315 [Nanoarchaeota archaeon]|nr:hypothetical protein [Nanoarchaeota archaeon]
MSENLAIFIYNILSGINYTNFISLILSFIAIGISILTFYLVHMYKGKVKIATPNFIQINNDGNSPELIGIDVPCVFINTGAKTKSISLEPITICHNNIESIYRPNNEFCKFSGKKENDILNSEFLTTFALKPHDITSKNISFFSQNYWDKNYPHILYTNKIGKYSVSIKGRINDGSKINTLCEFSFIITKKKAKLLNIKGIAFTQVPTKKVDIRRIRILKKILSIYMNRIHFWIKRDVRG